ncbi:MAG: winged helix-turn-helix domain-containing protein, partial [Eubacteriales bacterium]|nr:winged helix-turn-helix domain-containing protein [Eubacteriales bacterium]
EHRGAVLDVGQGVLSYQDKRMELTRNESRILQTLMEHKGATVSRDALMRRLWDSDCFIDDNTLTVNVARLRKRLEEMGLCGFIVTRKGEGYLVEAQ